jgi:hypothetical protein
MDRESCGGSDAGRIDLGAGAGLGGYCWGHWRWRRKRVGGLMAVVVVIGERELVVIDK